MKNVNEVAALYGAEAGQVTVLAGNARGFIPGELGIQLSEGEVINLEDQVMLIKTPRLPQGMKAISIANSKLLLPLGTLLKRDAQRKLHPDTEKMLADSKCKDADSLVKYLSTRPIVVTVKEKIQVQKFVDGQPDGDNTVESNRYGFKLHVAAAPKAEKAEKPAK